MSNKHLMQLGKWYAIHLCVFVPEERRMDWVDKEVRALERMNSGYLLEFRDGTHYFAKSSAILPEKMLP